MITEGAAVRAAARLAVLAAAVLRMSAASLRGRDAASVSAVELIRIVAAMVVVITREALQAAAEGRSWTAGALFRAAMAWAVNRTTATRTTTPKLVANESSRAALLGRGVVACGPAALLPVVAAVRRI